MFLRGPKRQPTACSSHPQSVRNAFKMMDFASKMMNFVYVIGGHDARFVTQAFSTISAISTISTILVEVACGLTRAESSPINISFYLDWDFTYPSSFRGVGCAQALPEHASRREYHRFRLRRPDPSANGRDPPDPHHPPTCLQQYWRQRFALHHRSAPIQSNRQVAATLWKVPTAFPGIGTHKQSVSQGHRSKGVVGGGHTASHTMQSSAAGPAPSIKLEIY